MQPIEKKNCVEQVIVPSNMLPEAVEILEAHGISFLWFANECVVTFPFETTKKEQLPRMPLGERYIYILTDDFHVVAQYDRFQDIYILFYECLG